MFYLDVTGAEAAEGAGELVAEALPALPFDFSLSFLACAVEELLLPDEEELVPPLAAAADGAADVTALEPAPAAGELLLLLVVGRLEWLLEGAECEKSAMDIKYSTDTKIEDNSRAFKLQKANFDKEVNSAKAEAQLAYELQAAKIQQKIRNEEIQIQVVERRKQIEIEEQEIKRKEKELTATVKLPAEAEAFKVQTVAEGNRTKVVETAKAEGEKIKLIGGAEARAVEAVGKAEAEGMRLKAAAYKNYGDAAVMSLVLEALPSIAAEVAAPLAKTDEIVLIGGNNNTTNEINKLVGTLPPAIQALTGVDITGALGKIPGATMVK